ncbi:hypothetical protein BDF20DRAFT_838403 [Mycotypha africana]|uniref:uncharacterized protein n=1 Tax=Mycotypha africana TaxID=64632 RepID=UPI002300DB24|nr:uncharacterized protein BDF20DRAFT_838403 [Mycotypha africana]KAI8969993.1 hypothetical protein BDF20DRAFT_838403 [Mycotypha africana]
MSRNGDSRVGSSVCYRTVVSYLSILVAFTSLLQPGKKIGLSVSEHRVPLGLIQYVSYRTFWDIPQNENCRETGAIINQTHDEDSMIHQRWIINRRANERLSMDLVEWG